MGIIYYKKLSPSPVIFPFYTMYSPHSWVGFVLLCLWTFQMIVAVCSEYIPSVFPDQRFFFKYHRFVGMFIFSVGLATCAMGFQNMQGSDLAGSTSPTANITFTEMLGYFPDSRLAQYASACSVLLLLSGLATFATFIR